MATLSTPSEAVQSAVAECLAPLVKSIKADGKAVELLHASLAKALKTGFISRLRYMWIRHDIASRTVCHPMHKIDTLVAAD